MKPLVRLTFVDGPRSERTRNIVEKNEIEDVERNHGHKRSIAVAFAELVVVPAGPVVQRALFHVLLIEHLDFDIHVFAAVELAGHVKARFLAVFTVGRHFLRRESEVGDLMAQLFGKERVQQIDGERFVLGTSEEVLEQHIVETVAVFNMENRSLGEFCNYGSTDLHIEKK